jgi:hypothetical protein
VGYLRWAPNVTGEKFTNIFWRQEMWQTKNKIKRLSRRKQKKLCTVTHQGVRRCALTTLISLSTTFIYWLIYLLLIRFLFLFCLSFFIILSVGRLVYYFLFVAHHWCCWCQGHYQGTCLC